MESTGQESTGRRVQGRRVQGRRVQGRRVQGRTSDFARVGRDTAEQLERGGRGDRHQAVLCVVQTANVGQQLAGGEQQLVSRIGVPDHACQKQRVVAFSGATKAVGSTDGITGIESREFAERQRSKESKESKESSGRLRRPRNSKSGHQLIQNSSGGVFSLSSG